MEDVRAQVREKEPELSAERALFDVEKSPISPLQEPLLTLTRDLLTHLLRSCMQKRALYRPEKKPVSPIKEPYVTRQKKPTALSQAQKSPLLTVTYRYLATYTLAPLRYAKKSSISHTQ